VLLTFAIEKRLITVNPCREVPKLKEKPRRRYMPNEEMLKVRAGAITGSGGRKNANGEMMALLIDFAYLSGLRAKDVRCLRWPDVDDEAGEIIVEPTKTRESSGARIAIEITPDIKNVLDRAKALGKIKGLFVFHTLKGGQFTASAIKSAWRRARKRAGLESTPWFRDLRPKALSDAKRRGVRLDDLRDAAGHSSVTTTEGTCEGSRRRKRSSGSICRSRRKLSSATRSRRRRAFR
jgi:integrase